MWWCAPVVPATWEAEAEELLEPRRQRLQCDEIVPLHSGLGDRLCLKKKNAIHTHTHTDIQHTHTTHMYLVKTFNVNKGKVVK